MGLTGGIAPAGAGGRKAQIPKSCVTYRVPPEQSAPTPSDVRPELGQISAHFDPAVSHPVGHSSAQHGESSCPFARGASPTALNLVYRALLPQRTHRMELALEQLGDSESVPGREFGPPNRGKAGPASAQISVSLNTNPLASGLRHVRTPIRDPSQVRLSHRSRDEPRRRRGLLAAAQRVVRPACGM